MITSRQDYIEYVQEDIMAIYEGKTKLSFRQKYGINRTGFQLALRRAEYYTNCSNMKLLAALFRWIYRYVGHRCGYTIPMNVCGKGLNIAHEGTIVVSYKAHIGDYCRIHTCVNIGVAAGSETGAPVIGNGVYIGPGAKIFGPISIADGVAVGANAVVNKSFNNPNITIAGVPAKQISSKGSKELLYWPTSKD